MTTSSWVVPVLRSVWEDNLHETTASSYIHTVKLHILRSSNSCSFPLFSAISHFLFFSLWFLQWALCLFRCYFVVLHMWGYIHFLQWDFPISYCLICYWFNVSDPFLIPFFFGVYFCVSGIQMELHRLLNIDKICVGVLLNSHSKCKCVLVPSWF